MSGLLVTAHCMVGVAGQFVQTHFSRTEIATSEIKLTRQEE